MCCRVAVWAGSFDVVIRVADWTPSLIARVRRNVVLWHQSIVLPHSWLAFLLVVFITVVGVRVGISVPIAIALGFLKALFCVVVVHLAMGTPLTSVVLLTTVTILATVVSLATIIILTVRVPLRTIVLNVSRLATLVACSGPRWDTIISVYVHSVITVFLILLLLRCHFKSVCESRPLSRFVESRMRC
jgi:hypothetical protein